MEKKSGISIQTLLISALAAVAAAVVVPLIWERGTLIATAMTPVIVALVSEALRKPAQAISTVAPRVTRRSATGAAVRSPEAYEPPTEQFDPLPPSEREYEPETRADDPFGLRASPTPRVKRHWKIALATGAAAFAVAVVFLTGTELVFGGAATKDNRPTTFFGSRSTPTPTPTPTPTATQSDEATPTPTPTATPTATATPTVTVAPQPQSTTAPTPTPTP
jgi:hypothetical protein